MFGMSKKPTAESLEKLVQQKKWDKIKKSYLDADEETKVLLAKACVTSVSDDSSNILMALLDSPEESVKLAALESLEKVGNDHCVSRIQQMIDAVPPEDTKLREQIKKTLGALRGKQ